MSKELESRVQELEVQNSFLEQEVQKNTELVDQLNLQIFQMKEELLSIRKQLQSFSSQETNQEILHNGQNR